MRVFIQAKNGIPTDQDHFNAYIGFREMGFETVFFETFEELAESKMDDVERLSMCEDTAAGVMLRAMRMSWNPV